MSEMDEGKKKVVYFTSVKTKREHRFITSGIRCMTLWMTLDHPVWMCLIGLYMTVRNK